MDNQDVMRIVYMLPVRCSHEIGLPAALDSSMFISAEGMCMFILYIRDATSKDELMLVKGMIALPPCSDMC